MGRKINSLGRRSHNKDVRNKYTSRKGRWVGEKTGYNLLLGNLPKEAENLIKSAYTVKGGPRHSRVIKLYSLGR